MFSSLHHAQSLEITHIYEKGTRSIMCPHNRTCKRGVQYVRMLITNVSYFVCENTVIVVIMRCNSQSLSDVVSVSFCTTAVVLSFLISSPFRHSSGESRT